MGISDARKRANKKWNDANMAIRYDRIQLIVPKGRKSTIEDQAKKSGETVSGYLNRLAREDVGLSEDAWKKTQREQDGEAET